MLDKNDQFVGASPEVFWGVVEDVEDPLQMGRVRVRCYGYHTSNLSQIAVEDLPWATVLLPVVSSGMSGIGENKHRLLPGSTVMGIFRDGSSAQDPVVIGSIASFPVKEPNPKVGFSDPSGIYPNLINEPDVNRLARDDAWETHWSIAARNGDRTTDIETAIKAFASVSSTSWNEPLARNGADSEYPHNHVIETESGHVIEIDDTPGSERIHERHVSGTYNEIYNDGTVARKIVGNNYTIILGSDSIYIVGDCNITVDGNCKHLVKGDYDLDVRGNYNVRVGANKNQQISADKITAVGGDSNSASTGNVTITGARIDLN